MYFFCTQMIDAKASGIEHAMMKRLKVFQANNQVAMILTRDYNRAYHHNLSINGLRDEQAINMFDYFQEAVQTDIENVVDPNKLIVPKDSLEMVLVQSFSSIRNLVELKKIIGSWSHELV